MKKLFVSFMTAFLMGSASITFASPSNDTLPVETSVVVLTQNMKLDVVTQANEQSSVSILLRDANGHILSKKYVGKGEGASRWRFDLSNLEDGEYSVEVNDGISKQVKTVTIQTAVPTPSPLRSISLS